MVLFCNDEYFTNIAVCLVVLAQHSEALVVAKRVSSCLTI